MRFGMEQGLPILHIFGIQNPFGHSQLDARIQDVILLFLPPK